MAAVEDPRVDRTKAHELVVILVLSVLAVFAGLMVGRTSNCSGRYDYLGFASSSSSVMVFLHTIRSAVFFA
jgi:hypothetical protein